MPPFKPRLLSTLLFVLAAVAAASGLLALGRNPGPLNVIEASAATEPESLDGEPISPLPLTISLDIRKVELGKRLFGDSRLSLDNTISCARAITSSKTARRSGPFRWYWGCAWRSERSHRFQFRFQFSPILGRPPETLEDQIDGPIHDRREMATDWPQILDKLARPRLCHCIFFDLWTPDGQLGHQGCDCDFRALVDHAEFTV